MAIVINIITKGTSREAALNGTVPVKSKVQGSLISPVPNNRNAKSTEQAKESRFIFMPLA